MKFSATAITALVSLCLTQGGATNPNHPGKPRLRNTVKASSPRPLWEQETSAKEAKLIRPLWEQMPKEAVEDQEPENTDADLLGVLAPPSHKHKRHHGHRDQHRTLQGISCVEEDGCDCANFDESTSTGNFECVTVDEEEGTKVIQHYEIYDFEAGNYMIENLLVFSDGFSYGYGQTYEGGVVTSCTSALNGCDCECTIGTCSDSADTVPVSFKCPILPAFDACDENFNIEDLMRDAGQCELFPFMSGTVAPSVEESMGGTSMESEFTTMLAT